MPSKNKELRKLLNQSTWCPCQLIFSIVWSRGGFLSHITFLTSTPKKIPLIPHWYLGFIHIYWVASLKLLFCFEKQKPRNSGSEWDFDFRGTLSFLMKKDRSKLNISSKGYSWRTSFLPKYIPTNNIPTPPLPPLPLWTLMPIAMLHRTNGQL